MTDSGSARRDESNDMCFDTAGIKRTEIGNHTRAILFAWIVRGFRNRPTRPDQKYRMFLPGMLLCVLFK